MVKNRLLLAKIGSILMAFWIITFCYSKAEGADWKLYAENQNFYFYHNVEAQDPLKNILDIFRKKIVKAWTKRVIKGDKGRDWQIQENKRLGISTKGYDNYEYTIFLKEINCSDSMVRPISEADYTKERNLLSKAEFPYAEWKHIIPESDDEALHKAVCTLSKTETTETETKQY